MKIAYFVIWLLPTLLEGTWLHRREGRRADTAVFCCLSAAALGLGVVYACLPTAQVWRNGSC